MRQKTYKDIKFVALSEKLNATRFKHICLLFLLRRCTSGMAVQIFQEVGEISKD